MTFTRTPLEASGFVSGLYGQPVMVHDAEYGDYETFTKRQGVVNDHVRAAAELPGVRVVTGALATYVVDDAAGGLAYPVLCGDIIEVFTEDGPSDGRCGLLGTDPDYLSCEGHAAERRAYMAMSEAERAFMEREEARLYG